MKATLSDKIYLTELSRDKHDKITKSLTFNNPKYAEAMQQGRSTYGIDRKIELSMENHTGLVIPRGVSFDWLNPDEIVDDRNTNPVAIQTSIKPRLYQERAVNLAIHHGGGVIVAPTGAGKTTMGIEIAAILGQRCLILVKSLDLAKQWQAAIKQFTGLECGLIGGGKFQEGAEFTVGLTQTLVKRPGSLDYGLVILDECHNAPASQVYEVINRQAAKYRFGLSATPQRRDNLEFMIHAALGRIVAEVESNEVDGAVLPVTVTTMQHDFMGDPKSWAEFINLLAKDDERNRKIVASAIKSSRTMGTAILTATISHSEELTRMAKQHGVSPLLLHGQLPGKVRTERMTAAPNHSLIIGTLSLLSEGIDWPHIGNIIFGSPVSASIDRDSPAATRLIQSIGRARRPFEGKTMTHVMDIVDSHPLGKSAYCKRQEVYRRQSFKVIDRYV